MTETGEPWFWMIASAIFLILELLAPGAFMLWISISCGLLSGFLFLIPLSFSGQLITAALLSVIFVIAHIFLRKQTTEIPLSRADKLVGSAFPLHTPLVAGNGSIRVGDTTWQVQGETNLPQGHLVTVTHAQGTVLFVAPHSPPTSFGETK